MTFFSLAGKNCLRQRARGLITAVAVAVGSFAAVVLAGLAWGFEHGVESTYMARGTDLVVVQMTSRNPIPSVFDQKRGAQIAKWPGVAALASSSWNLLSLDGGDSSLVYGWEPGSFLWKHLTFLQGDPGTSGNGVYLGQITARRLGKSVGDPLRLGNREFRVVGIFQSEALLENGAAILPLDVFQELTSTQGRVRHLNIQLAPDASQEVIDQLQKGVGRNFRGLKAVTITEIAHANSGVQAAKAMSAATVLIAFLIASLGVANSLLMSVFERESEIGLLMALGWRRRRVLTMVLVEALAVILSGAVAGALAGIAGAAVIQRLPFMRGQIAAEIPPGLIVGVLMAASLAGLLGALYPAIRAASLNPQVVLHDL